MASAAGSPQDSSDGESQDDDAGQHAPVGIDHPGPEQATRHLLTIGQADQGAGEDLQPLPEQKENQGGGQRGGADDAKDQPGDEGADGEFDRIRHERRNEGQRQAKDEERSTQQYVVQPMVRAGGARTARVVIVI